MRLKLKIREKRKYLKITISLDCADVGKYMSKSKDNRCHLKKYNGMSNLLSLGRCEIKSGGKGKYKKKHIAIKISQPFLYSHFLSNPIQLNIQPDFDLDG